MREWMTIGLMAVGALFMLLAAVGVLRLPDLFTRMQAATKASTLGVVFTMLAVAVHFGTLDASVRALIVIVFMFATVPVAAHVLARAAHHRGVELWEGTLYDELCQDYDARRRAATVDREQETA